MKKFLFFENSKSKGFTLIELLVVVAIISLLSSIIFVTTSQLRIKARNSVRFQTMEQILNAFRYAQITTNTVYPFDGPTAWYCLSASCSGTSIPATNAINYISEYLKASNIIDPLDQNRGGYYGFLYYSYIPTTTVPLIYFRLEPVPGGTCGKYANYGVASTYPYPVCAYALIF